MRRLIFITLTLLLPVMALAQSSDEDDGGFLTRTIEGLLSGAGREVSIRGFQGALSSEASFESLTISDGQGVWLTVEDVTLVWSRLALLRGRLEVDRLSAATIDLSRLPIAAEDQPVEIPDAEAEPFALPELPVSVNVQAIDVGRISLGEPVLGVAAQLSLAASAQLDDAAARVDATAERVDGATGRFGIKAGFERETSQITLDIDLREDPEGLVARLLKLPGLPAVEMRIAGDGPIDDFQTQIALNTDGTPRLQGQVSLSALPGEEGTAPDRSIKAQLGGDITALIAPEYHDFFGPDIAFSLEAVQRRDGAIDIDRFALDSLAAKLAGEVRLNEDKWPSFIDVVGQVRNASGDRVVLPGTDAGVSLQEVLIKFDFDAAKGDAFTGRFDVSGLKQEDVELESALLEMQGVLHGVPGAVGQFLSDLKFSADGLALTDPALAAAVGNAVSGVATINYIEGQPIRISDLSLSGADYGLKGQVIVRGLEAGFPTRVNLTVQADDITRFSEISGQALSGAASLGVAGTLTPLSGMFDLRIDGNTVDVTLGIAQADAVMAGTTELSLQAKRDETGTFVEGLSLTNAAVQVTADAGLKREGSSVEAAARLNDLALVVPEHSGPVTLDVRAIQTPAGWRVNVDGDAPYDAKLTIAGLATGPDADVDLTISVPELNPLVPTINGPLRADGRLWQSEEGYRVDLKAMGPHDASITLDGIATGPAMAIRFNADVPEINPLVASVEGPLKAQGRVWQSPEGYRVDTTAEGPYALTAAVKGLATGANAALDIDVALPDVAPLVPSVSGPLTAGGRVRQTPDGYHVDIEAEGPYAAKAAVEGLATGAKAALEFALSLPDIQPLVPSVSGPVSAAGRLWQTEAGYEVDIAADGPHDATVRVAGLATGAAADLDLRVAVPDVQPFVPQASGPLTADGRVWQTTDGYRVDVTADGPYAAKAAVEGLATGPEMALNFDLAVPDVRPLAPGFAGALATRGRVWQTTGGLNVDLVADGPYQSRVLLNGQATGADAALTFSADMPNLNPIVPQLNGPLSATGTAERAGAAWDLASRISGPSGTTIDAGGRASDDGTLDIKLAGNLPLGLTGPFLAPRILKGQAVFDLAINGAPQLGSLSGTIRTSNASFTAPNLRLALTDIATNVALSGARADISVKGNVSTGGQIEVDGNVGLDAALLTNLRIALRQVILTDPRLYSTLLNGDLSIDGPLSGGAGIAGTINVGETVITVPSASLTGAGEIPDIVHIGASGKVTQTRERAGVIPEPESEDSGAQGPGFGLDITVNAPARIFIRGRGVDAELGGSLDLNGTTSQIISSGRFELVRGRIDILAKRFDLDEGVLQFQGDLIPYLRFVTTSSTKTGTASVILEGPADDPEIKFESSPAGPEDEVLAQLLFGTSLSDISAFQALQLANAVIVLAGGKGIGVVGNLRDGFGLDDLDITTTDSGETAVRAGKYISENIYTDITAAGNGESEVSLNFDLTKSLKARGTVESDGDTAVGLFFERDY